MNRTSLARRLPALLMAALVLAAPAFAQETGTRSVVIKVGDGEPIVIIDGEQLSPEEAREYLDEHGGEIILGDDGHSIIVRRGDRPFLRGGHFMDDFRGQLADPPVFELEDFTGALDGLHGRLRWMGEPGGVFLREFGASMEEQAEISRMEVQSQQLAREARQAEGAERERLETELRELLADIFARKQDLRQERIDRLRQQLDEMAEEHRDRESARSEIIERRLKRLLGENDRYDW